MTNTQLYLAIGIPLILNTMLTGFFWLHMNTRIDAVNTRIDDMSRQINFRFDDMQNGWYQALTRVEQVLDARLKHLEEKIR